MKKICRHTPSGGASLGIKVSVIVMFVSVAVRSHVKLYKKKKQALTNLLKETWRARSLGFARSAMLGGHGWRWRRCEGVCGVSGAATGTLPRTEASPNKEAGRK